MAEDKELEKLRQRRLLELQTQQRLMDQERQAEAQEDLERRKDAVLRRILTSEARQRLANLKMVRPDFAEQIEMQLIQVAQGGKIHLPIDENTLKRLLVQLQSDQQRETKIRRI